MLGTKQIVDRESTPYATSANFCRIFEEDMNGLYLLSFLLTADREKAEQCFVSGLEDSVDASPVFKEWARSWARRAIIQNAVRFVKPRPAEGNGRSGSSARHSETIGTAERPEIAAVLGLGAFDRFVYVMSVLEHYSDQDCCVLLSCSRKDLVAARTRAFQKIGTTMTRHHHNQLPDVHTEKQASHDRSASVLEFLIAPPLPTSA
jgi:hypothetical protein